VAAIVFVVSLSEYDLKCYEDDSTMRMKESLVLFDEICNSKFFQNTPIILLFNKDDLFKKKIQNVDLKCCFEKYEGGKDYNNALKYIEVMFRKQNQDESKEARIKTFVSCATDTENIKRIFEDVKKIF
jgi:guanine nucleotide-binding protein G(i) subunit alpha